MSSPDDKNMTFNCIDFRREKLADPRRLSEAAEEHLIACPACQAFSRRVNAGERMLQQTVAVDVPDGLAERILVGSRARTRSPLKLWALAASMVLSLGLGVQYWHAAPDREHVALAVEHVMHEPEALMSTRLIEPQRVAQVLESFGAEVKVPLTAVRYVKLCPVPGGTGWHIVFDTPDGPATVLLMPQKDSRVRTLTTQYRGMGVHVEAGGQGVVAVVARDPDRARGAAGLLHQHVSWTPTAALNTDERGIRPRS
ncbi:DUF3379 family protein [Methyloversatilis discipulorum]|uniref:DUF3379 family protein n=1 Tax=Methyloversatilis discipulorum TaxID=1119528 RepID=UPI00045E90CC|nr:DUF3379 family protein [Methyloversatilis discipulorum]